MMCTPLPAIRSASATPENLHRRRQSAMRDSLLVGMALVALLQGESRAGELAPRPGDDRKPDLRPSPGPEWYPVAAGGLSYAYPPVDSARDAATFPSRTFRPRGHSVLEKPAAGDGVTEMPLLRTTTVWQRLSEYRTRDRVRVLTLWETGGNTVSLQADHKGGPSLQWTSRLSSRSDAGHGILDALFSKSLGAVLGRSLRGTIRPPAADGGSGSPHLPETGTWSK